VDNNELAVVVRWSHWLTPLLWVAEVMTPRAEKYLSWNRTELFCIFYRKERYGVRFYRSDDARHYCENLVWLLFLVSRAQMRLGMTNTGNRTVQVE
jgi:hypothetical protein